MTDLSTYWKDYDPETGVGDPSTPLAAQTLNEWGADVEQIRADAETFRNQAQEAAEQAAAPTDGQMAAVVDNPTSDTRARLDARYQLDTGTVTPEMFGAVGDATTDDTAAVQAFFEHLGEHGGTGIMAGRYRTTTEIGMRLADGKNPDRGFTVTGAAPDAAILLDVAVGGATNIVRIERPVGVVLADLTLEAVNAPAAHGLSISSALDTTVRGVTVRNYTDSGIIFHASSGEWPTQRGNLISKCNVYGEGIANNGVLFVSAEDSVIEDTNVYGVRPDGAPGYGLQLKNNCRGCTIRGGVVDGARVGVAFGSDTDTTNANHTVTGVVVRNIGQNGFLASKTVNSTVDLQIDMGGTGSYPVSLTLDCSGLHVTAAVDNAPVAVAVVNFASGDCTVTLDRVSGSPPALARFRAGVTTSTLRTYTAPAAGDTQVEAGGAAHVQYIGVEDTGWVNLALENGWAQVSTRTPQVRRIGNVVHMRGQVTGGTGPVMATLPDGFNPTDQTISKVLPTGGTTAAMTINTSGVVNLGTTGISPWLNESWARG